MDSHACNFSGVVSVRSLPYAEVDPGNMLFRIHFQSPTNNLMVIRDCYDFSWPQYWHWTIINFQPVNFFSCLVVEIDVSGITVFIDYILTNFDCFYRLFSLEFDISEYITALWCTCIEACFHVKCKKNAFILRSTCRSLMCKLYLLDVCAF